MKLHTFSELDCFFIKREIDRFVKSQRVKRVLRNGNKFIIFFEKKSTSIDTSSRFYRVTVGSFKQEGQVHSLLQQYLKNLRFKEIELPPGERIFIFHFTGRSALYEPLERKIVVELFGRFRDISLIAQDKVIWDLKKRNTGKRWNLPHRDIHIFSFENPEWFSYIKKHYPYFEKLKIFNPEDFKRILKEKTSTYYLYYQNNKPFLPSPFYIPDLGLKYKVFKTYSDCLNNYYSYYEKQEEEKKKDKVLRKGVKKSKRTKERILKELERMEDPESYKKKGEFVLQNIDKLLKGPIIFPDTNEVIKLSKGEKPVLLAKMFFTRYKKLRVKKEKLLKRLKEIGVSQKKNKVYTGERVKVKQNVYIAPSGFKVLVGKNREDSHQLTFNRAKPWDYFFHIKDRPGPHIILKRGRTEKLDERDILFAGKIAASKAGAKGKTQVVYTEKRNVRPTKKVGFVKITREKTLWVNI